MRKFKVILNYPVYSMTGIEVVEVEAMDVEYAAETALYETTLRYATVVKVEEITA